MINAQRMRAAAVACASAAAVAGGMLAVAGTAQAGLTTYCVGEGGAVTVPGDLVVPKNKVCELSGTTVLGNVRVAKGADLIGTETDMRGDVRVAANGYFEAEQGSVDGRVVSRGFGVFTTGTTLGDDLLVRPGGETGVNLAYVEDSELAGSVNANTGQLVMDGSSVGGSVISRNAEFADVYNSSIDQRLVNRGSELGSFVCDSEIYGNAAFVGNAQLVYIGANETINQCSSANYWGGNVRVSDNTADLNVSNNIVRGNLSGTGNDPAPYGTNNRVRGQATGQFAELPESPQGIAARGIAAPKQQRHSDVAAQLKQRGAEASAKAEAEGPAAGLQ